MFFIIHPRLLFIYSCYHLFILITFILLVLILTHCHYLPLASIITLYFLAFGLTLSIFTWPFLFALSHEESLVLSLRHALVPFTSFCDSLPYSAYIHMAIFCEYLMGHLLHPDSGSHLSFPHYFVVPCLPLPHQASFALQSTSLCAPFLLLID